MSKVREYYDACAEEEWGRLERDDFHRLEFRATMACLRERLPGSGLVLDAGGGPGRYARELCRQGYEVALVDLSPRSVGFAQRKIHEEESAVAARLKCCESGDVRDLSRFADNSFDAVLCGGALSHLLTVEDRRQALREFVRVAAPGAPVIISVIGYYAVLVVLLRMAMHEVLDPARYAMLMKGDHVGIGGFTDAHFYRPEELRALAEEAGLQTVEMRACEGLSSNQPEATNALREQGDGRWERWLEVLEETCHESAMVATSEHFLYVGRTKET